MPKICPQSLIYWKIKTGRVRVNNASPMNYRFWNKVNKEGQIHFILRTKCWIWTAHKYPKGYGQFGFNGKVTAAHRVSWILHYGPIPEGLLVCHRCDNPSCVNPEHLFLGTAKDNAEDMGRKGRQVKKIHRRRTTNRRSLNPVRRIKGIMHHSVKLTAGMVLRARKLSTEGYSNSEIHKLLNCSCTLTALRSAINKTNWRHI